MKKLLQAAVVLLLVMTSGMLVAQDLKPVELSAPDKTRGLPVMEALSVRASAREWSATELSLRDLSDLLWAASGVNRPDGRKTASSAMNAQDIDVYVFMQQGIYIYDAQKHVLNPVVAGDYRDLPGKTNAPVTLVLVSDISRFGAGSRPPQPASAPDGSITPAPPPPAFPDSLKLGWGNMDAGIVSQNISIFCAGTGLKTRPRASFPGGEKIRELLSLKPSQYVLMNHPVGYAVEN